ncbi:AAA family ATPase [Luteimonas aquatica]|uniref:AAA family ATPase n=1 Tax=Luteimonas aquatica TaxID=450364 RepID=UPI001F567D1E|nr:AAA family ATPase [Luteimonas aquatica]
MNRTTSNAFAQRQAPTATDLNAVEADLDALSRRIDAALRRHFAGWRLHRLLRAAAHGATAAWLPSWWTLLAAAIALIGVGVSTDGASPLRYVLMAAIVVAALLFEMRVRPRVSLAAHRFRLMRLTAAHEAGDYPHAYTVARIHDSGSGFATLHWKSMRGVAPGDIVASVSDAQDRGLAIIVLRTEGWLPIMVWDRDLYQDNALPPLPAELQQLAREFGAACDTYRAHAPKIERSRALRAAPPAQPRRGEAAWARIALPEATATRLTTMARHFAQGSASAARGLLLYGPPGTGKTLVAKALADSLDCAFFALSLPDLKAGYVGQSGERVREIWHRALAEPQAIVFVDECEGVFARRGGTHTDAFGEDIVNAFIAQWDGIDKQSSVWVIGASNRRDLIDPAILSRFEDQIQIGLPDEAQRLEILRHELDRLGRATALPARAAALTQGMSGRDLAGLAKRIARELADDAPLSEAVLDAYTVAFRRQGSTATDAGASWDTLVLAERTLQDLKTTAGLLKNADTFLKRGIGVPRGLLLYGPPGTGKTQIARTLANETGLRFIAASTADVKQGWLGQSGQKVRELFERARESAPSLLFIDEIDVIAGSRGGGDAFTDEIIGQLLQEMDGVQAQPRPVFVVAATNRVEHVDAALLSRLSKRIEVPLPDAEGIRRLLRVMLAGKPLAFEAEAGIAHLAGYASGWSGRGLRNWIEHAEMRAVHRAIEAGDPDSVALTLDDFAA